MLRKLPINFTEKYERLIWTLIFMVLITIQGCSKCYSTFDEVAAMAKDERCTYLGETPNAYAKRTIYTWTCTTQEGQDYIHYVYNAKNEFCHAFTDHD
jgi:hypothetical protein